MKSLPLDVSFARLGNLPSTIRRVAPQVLTAGFALLLTVGLLSPAATLHAQTEALDRVTQDNNLRDDQAAADATPETTAPTVVLTKTSIKAPAEHSTASGVILTASKNGYSGTVNYSCELMTKTSTETPPMCAMDPGHETLAEGAKAQPIMLIFGKGTKLPTGVTEGSNATGNHFPWAGTGGAVLASCLLFGIPARRRRWKAILPILLLLVGVSGFAGCGALPQMITAGQYSFKVTATDAKDAKITTSVMIPVEVL